MKPLNFVGSSLDDLRNFPDEARRAAGFELRAVQNGLEPRVSLMCQVYTGCCPNPPFTLRQAQGERWCVEIT